MDPNDFYKQELFEQMFSRMERMEKKIDSIEKKINYIYGFAGGVGIFASLAFTWVKEKFFTN